MATLELLQILDKAQEAAQNRRHEHITLFHFLSVVLDTPSGARMLQQCGGNVEQMRLELDEVLATMKSAPVERKYKQKRERSLERVLDQALRQARASQQYDIEVGNVLAALFVAGARSTIQFVQRQGISMFNVRYYVSHGTKENNICSDLVDSQDQSCTVEVFMHNDSYTTMEFVVEVLKSQFRKSETEAMDIMLEVHNKGDAVVGKYEFSIAKEKCAEITRLARKEDFPFRLSMRIPS